MRKSTVCADSNFDCIDAQINRIDIAVSRLLIIHIIYGMCWTLIVIAVYSVSEYTYATSICVAVIGAIFSTFYFVSSIILHGMIWDTYDISRELYDIISHHWTGDTLNNAQMNQYLDPLRAIEDHLNHLLLRALLLPWLVVWYRLHDIGIQRRWFRLYRH